MNVCNRPSILPTVLLMSSSSAFSSGVIVAIIAYIVYSVELSSLTASASLGRMGLWHH
jgi:hypothetical protein